MPILTLTLTNHYHRTATTFAIPRLPYAIFRQVSGLDGRTRYEPYDPDITYRSRRTAIAALRALPAGTASPETLAVLPTPRQVRISRAASRRIWRTLCGFRDCSCGDALGHPGAIVIEKRRFYAAAQPDGSVVLQELPQTVEGAEDLEPLRPQTQGSIRTHPEPLTA